MVKSHTHPIGGNTGGSQAAITSAKSAAHTHNFNATHTHGVNDPGHTHTLGWDEYTPFGGCIPFVNLTEQNGVTPITGNATKYFTNAMAQTSTSNISIKEREITGYTGVQTDDNVTITQNNHTHELPANTSSNDAYANENRPENYTVKIWKRTA